MEVLRKIIVRFLKKISDQQKSQSGFAIEKAPLKLWLSAFSGKKVLPNIMAVILSVIIYSSCISSSCLNRIEKCIF